MSAEITEILLHWLDKEFPRNAGSAERPVWSHVEMRIDRAFKFGGSVRLHLVERVFEPREALSIIESISMDSRPEKFRLIVTPKRDNSDKKSNLREWWEPGDTPFRGTERFGDDEWDARTTCSDVSIAKKMFKDFFEHCGITEDILNETLWIWNRKPR